VNFDVTERKRIEEELRKSERQYRELVQNANSVIIRRKPDGTLTFFNEIAQKFFGYEEDEVIGKRADVLLPERESTGRALTQLHVFSFDPDLFLASRKIYSQ
jgi:PAS domain-containing protein